MNDKDLALIWEGVTARTAAAANILYDTAADYLRDLIPEMEKAGCDPVAIGHFQNLLNVIEEGYEQVMEIIGLDDDESNDIIKYLSNL